MIPNQNNFNESEEKFINQNISNLCFKDSAHVIQQQRNQMILEKDLPNNNLNSPIFSSNYQDLNTHNSNSYSNNTSTIPNSNSRKSDPQLGRKKSRKKQNDESEAEKAEPIGVKLVCDSPNDDLKKYFNKTVI